MKKKSLLLNKSTTVNLEEINKWIANVRVFTAHQRKMSHVKNNSGICTENLTLEKGNHSRVSNCSF